MLLSENFICMQESGSFPDPYNCTRYHVCKNHTAYSLECYNGTTYNSWTGQCDRTECYNFDCTSKTGIKVPYGKNNNIFAYCIYGMVMYADRCPVEYEFNFGKQKCVPACTREGYFADVTDTSKYYVCAKENPLFTSTPGRVTLGKRMSCRFYTVFDPSFFRCVSQKEE